MQCLKVSTILAILFVLAARVDAASKAGSTTIPHDQQKLIDQLQGNAAPADKALDCKYLAMIGDSRAVPALAALLPNAELSSWSRIALEAIPGEAADEALRAAAGRLQGRLLIGVINSLGVRHDPKSADVLIARLKDADPAVASAAAVALGHIGGKAAVAALQDSLTAAPKEVRSAAAEGCILCAEGELAANNQAEAVKLYDAVRAADVSSTRVLEATRGAILARGPQGVPLLIQELRSPDKKHFALGLTVARELPGREATEAVAAELERAAPRRQSLLILALADRGEASVVPQILKIAKNSPDEVRVHALRALKRIDESVSAPALLDAALEKNAAISQAALGVIDGLRGATIDGLIAERLPAASGAGRMILIELSGRRHIAAATAALWKSADDADPAVRAAALGALGGTIQLADFPQLVARLKAVHTADETSAVIKALQAAAQRMPDREGCAQKLAAALADAPAGLKCQLLEVLGALGGEKSLAAVAGAARNGDDSVRDAAYRLLGQWMSVDAAPVLRDLAASAKDSKYQVRAVRGYIRLARQLVMPQSDRESMSRTALEIAQRPDEKRLVLEIMLRYPSPEMLALAQEAAKSPELKDEATAVAMGIARGRPGDSVELRKALAQAGHQAVKLEIVKAEYGEGTGTKDVTAVLRHLAGRYRVIFLPSASYNETFGGDPAPGALKHLTVRYRINGKDGEVNLNENATVVLPMPR